MLKKILIFLFIGTLVTSISGCKEKMALSTNIKNSFSDTSSAEETSLVESEDASPIETEESASASTSSTSSLSSKKTVSSYVSAEPKSIVNTQGNITGNLDSVRGMITIQGEWIFYRCSYEEDNKGKLYKIKTDGTEKQKLDDISTFVYCINVIGDWVYYCASPSSDSLNDGYLMKIRTDGSQRQELEHQEKGHCSFLLAVKNTLYYFAAGGLYSLKDDGTDRKLLVECKISILPFFLLEGDYLYYVKNDISYVYPETTNRWEFLRVKTDGSEKHTLASGISNSEGSYRLLMINDGWIYYENQTDNNSKYKCKLDGSSNEKIEFPMSRFVKDGWIYFDDNGAITKSKINGTEKKQILDLKMSYDLYILEDGWIHFTQFSDIRTYKIKTDGTNLQLAVPQIPYS